MSAAPPSTTEATPPEVHAGSTSSVATQTVPPYLLDAMNVVTPAQKQLITTLYCDLGQEHLFSEHHFSSKAPPSMRRQMAAQLEVLDQEYADGGLAGYIRNCRTLLENSRNNVNPLAGWEPTLSTSGSSLELGTPEYEAMEQKGLPELGAVGFVLVAGGLGERLGYSGIKVRLFSVLLVFDADLHSNGHLIFTIRLRFC
jgi:UDP-sugar pyrophosphorylase